MSADAGPDLRSSPRLASTADQPRMAEALAQAFADDPAMAWVLPHTMSDRHQRLRSLFCLELPRSTSQGGAWTAAQGAAAAIWYPPGQWRPSPVELVRELPGAVRIFGRRLTRAWQVMAAMERGHPSAPHWYLYYLGAEPAHQGQGAGSALLRPVLARCDTDRVGAYLEASTERNRRLYERHGFRLVEELHLPCGGPLLWRMWRDPA